jgi:protein-L-isoaspartate(D-aspartate) O-methyltransferase
MSVCARGENRIQEENDARVRACRIHCLAKLRMAADTQSDLNALERERMVAMQLQARGIRDVNVLSAMARVPRHEFVPEEFRSQAYGDHPIPIGQSQTISQPYIVAIMLEYLALQPSHKVLEIGTGSGYQTALLAEMVAHVYSIERHAVLADSAKQTLSRLGYYNVTVFTGDGSEGLPEYSPFDGIIVAAAATDVPPALFEQLTEGGRMVIPVGPPESQELQLIRKEQGKRLTNRLEGCRFVPLLGGVVFTED